LNCTKRELSLWRISLYSHTLPINQWRRGLKTFKYTDVCLFKTIFLLNEYQCWIWNTLRAVLVCTCPMNNEMKMCTAMKGKMLYSNRAWSTTKTTIIVIDPIEWYHLSVNRKENRRYTFFYWHIEYRITLQSMNQHWCCFSHPKSYNNFFFTEK
jgi:hypothetical protein